MTGRTAKLRRSLAELRDRAAPTADGLATSLTRRRRGSLENDVVGDTTELVAALADDAPDDEPVRDETVDDAPVVDEPVDVERVVDGTVDDGTVVDETIVDEPVDVERVVDGTVDDGTVVDETIAVEPVDDERADDVVVGEVPASDAEGGHQARDDAPEVGVTPEDEASASSASSAAPVEPSERSPYSSRRIPPHRHVVAAAEAGGPSAASSDTDGDELPIPRLPACDGDTGALPPGLRRIARAISAELAALDPGTRDRSDPDALDPDVVEPDPQLAALGGLPLADRFPGAPEGWVPEEVDPRGLLDVSWARPVASVAQAAVFPMALVGLVPFVTTAVVMVIAQATWFAIATENARRARPSSRHRRAPGAARAALWWLVPVAYAAMSAAVIWSSDSWAGASTGSGVDRDVIVFVTVATLAVGGVFAFYWPYSQLAGVARWIGASPSAVRRWFWAPTIVAIAVAVSLVLLSLSVVGGFGDDPGSRPVVVVSSWIAMSAPILATVMSGRRAMLELDGAAKETFLRRSMPPIDVGEMFARRAETFGTPTAGAPGDVSPPTA